MMQGIVILLGNLPLQTLDPLVQEFGWSVDSAADLNQLRALSRVSRPIAILFDAQSLALPWPDALRAVRAIASQALLIPCHRFSDIVNWPELAEAGAFHPLALPLDPNEVRQTLSFVWSARFGRTVKLLPRQAEPRGAVGACRCGQAGCQCADSPKRATGS